MNVTASMWCEQQKVASYLQEPELKPGMHVWYRQESYDVIAQKPETKIIEVVIVAPAKGTDFSEADWIYL